MTDENVVEQLKALLQPLADSQDSEIVDIQFNRATTPQTVVITVDTALGVTNLSSDQVASLARAFSKELDKHDPIEGAYTLEVTSPGAETQLTNDRQYRRAIGRTVQVRLRDSDKVEGVMTSVDDDGFTLKTSHGDRKISFDQVRKARPVADTPRD